MQKKEKILSKKELITRVLILVLLSNILLLFLLNQDTSEISTPIIHVKENENYFVIKAKLLTNFEVGKEVIVLDKNFKSISAKLIKELNIEDTEEEKSFLIITDLSSIPQLVKMKNARILPSGIKIHPPNMTGQIQKGKLYEINY